MLDDLRSETDKLTAKIAAIKQRLNNTPVVNTAGSNEIIKTIAISKELTSELKEVLILLNTTMNTEFVEAKNSNYRFNLDLIHAAEEIATLQNLIINRLSNNAKKKPPQKFKFLSEYKRAVSTVIVILSLWILMLINKDATVSLLSSIQGLFKGGM